MPRPMSSEGDDIEQRRPEELRSHPQNEEIYGDRDFTTDEDAGFLESIREKGVLTPVIVNQNDQIIPGT
jgi:ParB-like chromosome segregation protein Spo0J